MTDKTIAPLAAILAEGESIDPLHPGKAKFLPPSPRTRWCTECVKHGFQHPATAGSALCAAHQKRYREDLDRARAEDEDDADVTTSAPRRRR